MFRNVWNRIKDQLSYYFDFRKISSKILVSTILISLSLPLAISIFLINFTETRINEYVLNRNENTVSLAKQMIELFIERPFAMMKSVSYNKSVVDGNVFQMRSYFIRLQRDFPIFRSISSVDALTHELLYTSDPNLQLDRADSLLIANSQNDAIFKKSIVSLRDNIDPTLKAYFPVKKFGQSIAVIICEIDLKYIWNLVDNITFGKYGEAILISDENKIIAHKEKGQSSEHKNLIKGIDKEKMAGTIFMENEIGDDIIGTYAKITKLNWYLVIEQKVDEARDLAIEMRLNLLIYLTVSLALAIIIGVLFSRRISRPIEELTDGVKNFGAGRLQQQIVVHSNDELQDLADEFNQMSKTLYYNQKKLRRIERISAMTKFVRMVSHEIRNPLNSMNINMQILKRELKKESSDKDKMNRYLDVFSSEIGRIDDLITNYTQMAKSPQLDIQKHDIHAILDSVVLLHKAEAESKQVKIKTIYANEEIWAQVDANQLKQVIINLVINAIQAMPKGGKLTILTMEKSDTIFMIKIEDTGKGIESDKLSEIFEFYYTSKETGSGIGLSLSKQIIEGHNGQIYVESRIGEGSTFYIELPIKQSTEFS